MSQVQGEGAVFPLEPGGGSKAPPPTFLNNPGTLCAVQAGVDFNSVESISTPLVGTGFGGGVLGHTPVEGADDWTMTMGGWDPQSSV